MLSHKIGVAALAMSASVLALEAANANTVMGTTWEVATAIAQHATLSNVPAASPNFATWSAPSDPLSFNSNADPVNGYTLGGFLATGSAFGVTYHGMAASTDTFDSTITEVMGTVSVTNGEKFQLGHDDGFSMMIGSTFSISDPGPTSFALTTFTYTGATGNQPFKLAYGECCGAPAVLEVDLALSSVPEPSTWAMMGLGFAGLGFVGFRRARKTSVSIA